jgi:para-aminobenzoate synthetase component I
MLNSVETIQTINSFVHRNIPFIFIISFNKETNQVLPLHQLPDHNIFFSTPEKSNIEIPIVLQRLNRFEKSPISEEAYAKSFQKVMQEIQAGNTYLLNLTMQTRISSNLDLYQLFLASQAPYKLYFQDKFTLFSPEKFISITDNTIKTFPMKGTISAEIPNACQTILKDEKEAAEHATIVDLLRNDLSRVSSEVKVNRYRYIEKVQTNDGAIYQVSSEIEGKLPEDYKDHLGEIIFDLLPAGSVTGAPKEKTIAIIHEAEPVSRGFYTGIFGIWDTNKLDSAVMIRFISKQNNKYWFHSGGGITFQSNCNAEYQEMIKKVYAPIY